MLLFQVITRYFNKTNDISDISGFSTIVQSLAKESKEQLIKNGLTDLETQCLVAQWVEYAVLYASSSDKHVTNSLLKELHIYLSTRSYFVGQSLTLADLAMYYAIENAMNNLHHSEKDQYLNLSRWFNHLQQNKLVRQNSELINFSTIHLIGWTTAGTHA